MNEQEIEMKIIHCADLHLDSKMESNLSKEKADERKAELLQTFTRMVDYAQENNVKAVIIAGDMFDTSNKYQIRIKKQVCYVITQRPSRSILYPQGTHYQACKFS